MKNQDVLKQKIDSLFMWLEELQDEFYSVPENGGVKNYVDIWNALNLIQRRAKEAKYYIEETQNIN